MPMMDGQRPRPRGHSRGASVIQSVAVGLEQGSLLEDVTETALQLAILHDCPLRAIYVEDIDLLRASYIAPFPALPPEGPIPMDPGARRELESKFRTEEQELGRRFLRLVTDFRLRGSFRVERGRVQDVLVDESRAHDLLVVGKAGGSADAAASTLGDHVEALARLAFCPLLVVPPGASLGGRILVAYDGSVVSHRALTTAVRLAGVQDARLRIVVVAGEEEGYDLLSKARGYVETHERMAELERRDGAPAAIILEEAERWDARILAMGAFGHGRISQLFGRAATHRILESVDRLVLLCGPQTAA